MAASASAGLGVRPAGLLVTTAALAFGAAWWLLWCSEVDAAAGGPSSMVSMTTEDHGFGCGMLVLFVCKRVLEWCGHLPTPVVMEC